MAQDRSRVNTTVCAVINCNEKKARVPRSFVKDATGIITRTAWKVRVNICHKRIPTCGTNGLVEAQLGIPTDVRALIEELRVPAVLHRPVTYVASKAHEGCRD